MPAFALVKDGQFVRAENFLTKPSDIPHKNVVWKPFVEEAPVYSPLTHKITGTNIVVSGTEVKKTWTIAVLDTSEVDDAKTNAVNGIDASDRQALFLIIHSLENEIRELRLKYNQLVDATSSSAALKFTNAQIIQVTLNQLKNAIKNLLS